MENIVDPDQTEQSDLGLHVHCWSRQICPNINPCPAEPGQVLLLKTVKIQISWLLKKPTDLDLHYLSFSMQIYINILD